VWNEKMKKPDIHVDFLVFIFSEIILNRCNFLFTLHKSIKVVFQVIERIENILCILVKLCDKMIVWLSRC